MGVRFACHSCGKRLNIKTELAGRRGICPACSVRFRIPEHDSEISTPVESDEAISSSAIVTDDPAPTPATDSAATSASAMQSSTASSVGEDIFGGSSATWFVRPPGGGQYGPADGPTMRQWIEEGRVADIAMIWRDGWQNWREAKEVISDQNRTPPPQSSPRNTALVVPEQPADHSTTKPTTKPTTDYTTFATQSPTDVTSRPGPLPSNKKKKSQTRIILTIVLGLIFIGLVGALIFVLTRSSF